MIDRETVPLPEALMSFRMRKGFRNLCLGLSAVAPALAASDVPSDTLKVSARILETPAAAILCLHVAARPLRFGHSALTVFMLDQKQTTEEQYVAKKARWVGFWPLKKHDKSEQDAFKSFLPFSHDDDFYKKFESDLKGKEGARHCVPVTGDELGKLTSFIDSKRSSRWWVHYNCNDLSTEAFELVTGVSFHPRSLSTLGCSHPAKLVEKVKAYQKNEASVVAKQLRYMPTDAREVLLLKKYSSKSENELLESVLSGSRLLNPVGDVCQ
jgi:hypothetical protein